MTNFAKKLQKTESNHVFVRFVAEKTFDGNFFCSQNPVVWAKTWVNSDFFMICVESEKQLKKLEAYLDFFEMMMKVINVSFFILFFIPKKSFVLFFDWIHCLVLLKDALLIVFNDQKIMLCNISQFSEHFFMLIQ